MDPAPHPSLSDSISRGLDWTGRVLFRPFDPVKWCVLGFCAWLAWLGEGGGYGGNYNWTSRRDEFREEFHGAGRWIDENFHLVLFLVAGLCLLGLVLWVLFTFLSSRGKFMFLDGVVRNRAAVSEPWSRYRSLANSLFGFRIVLALVVLLIIGGLVALLVAGVFALGLDEREPGFAALVMIVLWLAVIVAFAFGAALVAMMVNDFVVPVMWVRECRVMHAWSEVAALVSRNPGAFVLYVLLKILIAVIFLFIGCVATCVTCCVVMIPYVGTVLLLPLFVFRRSFSIHFLAQFGPDYAALGPAVAPIATATPESP